MLEVDWLTGCFTATHHDSLAGSHPKPSDSSFGERVRFDTDGDRGERVLPLGRYDGQASKRDEGGRDRLRLTSEPTCRRDGPAQLSPLTSRLGEGADPSGARQGSFR